MALQITGRSLFRWMGVKLNQRPVENMSLRELLRDADRLCRELADHLERGFAPKALALAKLLKSEPSARLNEGVSDRSVHDQVDLVVGSHRFTERVLSRIRDLLRAIDISVTGIAGGLRS